MRQNLFIYLFFLRKKIILFLKKSEKQRKKTILDLPMKIQCLILVIFLETFSHSLILKTLFPLKMLHHILNTASYIPACHKVLAGFKTA